MKDRALILKIFILSLFLFGAIVQVPVYAAHNSTASLEPEWSPANQVVNYTVTFCKIDGDTINEVRIYKNYDGSQYYTDFQCNEKPGWELLYIGSYPACFYVANSSSPYYNPLDENGECANFTFSAKTPPSGPGYCNLTWRFETRDVNYEWKYLYDNTSVDDLPPNITKTVGEPNYGDCPSKEDKPCWVTKSTQINVSVVDRGECGISGLDWCMITSLLDNSGPYQIVYQDLNGEKSWNYSFSFQEESNHTLNITCKDIAGNIISDLEVFKVDSTPPTTSKTYGEPFFSPNNNVTEWITNTTPIILTPVDPQINGCAVDNVKTWYYVKRVNDSYCQSPQNCQKVCEQPPHDCTYNNVCNWKEYTGPFTINNESCHIIQYYSKDALGNRESMKWQCVYVDNTPPVGIKTIGEPKYGDCSKPIETCDSWNCIAGLVKDFFITGRYGNNIPTGTWELAIWENTSSGEVVRVEDNYVWTNGEKVDFSLTYNSTDGNVTYTVGGKTLQWTYHSNKAFNYIIPFAKGDSKGNSVELTEMSINGKAIPNLYSGTGYKGLKIPLNDSEQINGFTITGKVKLIWKNSPANELPGFHIYVMNTHDLTPQDCWVRDHITPINLTCTDQGPHPANNEKVCYKVKVDGNDYTSTYCSHYGGNYTGEYCCFSKSTTLYFLEDSNHTLEYYCEDAVGNKNEVDTEYFKVDSQPPVITKTIGNPKIWNETERIWYVRDNVTPITIDAYDNETFGCAINNVTCEWFIELDEYGIINSSQGWIKPPFTIIFTEDSVHKLAIHCKDILGNDAWDNETFKVDSTPPTTSKTYGEPFYSPNNNATKWITSTTPIYLSATDGGDICKVGVDKIKYNVSIVDDYYCDNQTICQQASVEDIIWNEYTGQPFTIEEESCHLIIYYANDILGNTEPIKKQCVFVDNTPPIEIKTIGEPNKSCTESENCNYWVRNITPIALSCIDQGPHPVRHEWVCFNVSYDKEPYDLTQQYCANYNQSGTNFMDDGYCCVYVGNAPFTFTFQEDSLHDLKFYCKDDLGNKNQTIDLEYFRVDSTPPVTTKEIIGPYYNDTTTGKLYINGITNISLTCVDKEDPCAVGVDNIQYRYSVQEWSCKRWDSSCCKHLKELPDGIQINWRKKCCCEWGYTEKWTDWFAYEKPFSFTEESFHELEYYCNDTLGNEEVHHHESYYVDHTPPQTYKWYEGPQYPNLIEESTSYPHWITNKTLIHLYATDGELIHASGVNKTMYRVTMLDDNKYCEDRLECEVNATGLGEFKKYDGPFQINEESCHLIEYYSIDNVNKTENIHKQCVYVDNTPPIPNKTVGKPRIEWDGKDANFYDIADKCWSEDPEKRIECWKVTLFTPITLGCEDQGPHPVNHEETCYKVEVDGDDKTQYYCSMTKGKYNKSGDGFCCGLDAPYEFHFNEETEHNLKYYCVDALGNKGPIDEEKFKVEGTAFNITLNKKWNLISVPFVMLNDSIDEVFKDIAEDIEGVWTYDGETGEWYIYTPGPAPDNLHEMIPGWGYWVKAKKNTTLLIGGSLFTPAKTPPEKKVVHGWNLIGYYGTDGQTGYYGPYGNGKPVYCALYSLIDTTVGYPRWSSLVTYWEPDNPYQWKYLDWHDNMDPGAGYWIEMDVNDTYTFSTTCYRW